MSENYRPKEVLVMDAGVRPLAEPRFLIQSAFETDMETLGTIAGNSQVRELHQKLVKGEISKEIFLEAVRAMLEEGQ